MALYSYSRKELAERVGRLGLDDWKEGTCTGGTTATFVDTARYEVDDYFQNTTPISRVRILSTTDGLAPVGEEREIITWTQAGTGTILAQSLFTVAPAAGDTYVILSEYSWAEIVEAINSAIDLVGRTMLVDKISETTTLQSSVYEYPIPSGFIYIYRISMADGEGDYPDPLALEDWKIIRGLPTPRIHITRLHGDSIYEDHGVGDLFADSGVVAARTLRIEGLARQARLDTDDSICEINPEYVWRQAAASLHAKRIRRPENEPDEHRTKYQILKAEAEAIKASERLQLPPDSRRVQF